MGSSAKKKKEKKKDFQKVKLRVGKAKAKPDNFTDTSFRSKSIVLNQQSLSTSAPTTQAQFAHYLSLASSSKSDTQRRDALAFLTTFLSSAPVDTPLPVPPAIMLPKLLPLVLDGSGPVRANLLKLLRQLPHEDVGDRAEVALLYIRAGMTHLAAEIRTDALAVLEWLLETAGDEVVSCPGGWMKTLRAFMAMLGWAVSESASKWSSSSSAASASTSKASFGKAGKSLPRQILILSAFLRAGLGQAPDQDSDSDDERMESGAPTPEAESASFIWNAHIYGIPQRAQAYAHLNLFGTQRDEDGEMYIDREERQRVFKRRFHTAVQKGVDSARQEGGEAGRAAAVLNKVLTEGLRDAEE